MVTLAEAEIQQTTLQTLIANTITNLNKLGKANINASVLESRLKLLEGYWKQFYDNHLAMCITKGFDALDYTKNDVFDAVETSYTVMKAHLLAEQEKLQPKPQASPSSQIQTPASTSKRKSKLDKISVPHFSGDILAWEQFRDLFTSLIKDDVDLDDVTRLHYLKESLRGEAASVVSNLAITNANFKVAWDLLTNRYDNKRTLLYHYVEKILELKPATKESPAELKRILDTMGETKRALENLGRPAKEWDDWFVHLTLKKLDVTTRKDWETKQTDPKAIPKFKDLETFLEARLTALISVKSSENRTNGTNNTNASSRANQSRSRATATPGTTSSINNNNTRTTNNPPAAEGTVVRATPARRTKICLKCQHDHFLSYCPEFRALSPKDRLQEVYTLKLCTNCLGKHQREECQNTKRCLSCNGDHHTLLHDATPPTFQVRSCSITVRYRKVLLATAKIKVFNEQGSSYTATALLDPCAEENFVSERIAQFLRLKRRRIEITVDGIGGAQPMAPKYLAFFKFGGTTRPMEHIFTEALVLKNVLADRQTSVLVVEGQWPHLTGLDLADPDFGEATKIDVILGVGVYTQLIQVGLIKGPRGTPVAQNTALGWIIMGECGATGSTPSIQATPSFSRESEHGSLSEELRRFWEIEENLLPPCLSEDDQYCEKFFTETTYRNAEGRYVVRLPRRPEVQLGDSRKVAYHSLIRIERRLRNDPNLEEIYRNFMRDYENLGHMTVVEPNPARKDIDETPNFLPHHAVWKAGKFRVVFNAAAKTQSGFSLNDTLLPGPKLQPDIDNIITAWRRYPVVFTADVVKMFRQILVAPEDLHLQRIFWRDSEKQPVKEYQLQTVTYGTAPAPWLSLRVLKQLAEEERELHPDGSFILLNEKYVDECFSGGFDISEALNRKKDLIEILQSAGFELAKWASNVKELTDDANVSNRSCEFSDTDNKTQKTLGIFWNSTSDSFFFRVAEQESDEWTKRSVLSYIAKIYDPCGWIAPVTVTAKIFMQKIWTCHSDWDSTLPFQLLNEWKSFRNQLSEVGDLKISRWLGTLTTSDLQLHGFCDASEKAYAAVVYLRTTMEGETKVSMLKAKTRVSPLKPVTLPRLELCGALLLSRLIKRINPVYFLASQSIYLWTDSTVVLSWLQSHPSRWKCFVANRVSEIHELVPTAIWNHVPTEQNAADCASIGLTPSELKAHSLWWNGPGWLDGPESSWPQTYSSLEDIPDERRTAATPAQTVTNDLLNRYSSYTRLLRVSAWCRRFINNARLPPGVRKTGPLQVPEFRDSLKSWIKIVQSMYFNEEIHALTQQKPVSKKSAILTLNPFVDGEGILRVGGRLRNCDLAFSEKHPIILPGKCHFTTLIIKDFHVRTLHGNYQVMQGLLRRNYWITNGRRIIKSFIHKCITCVRHKAETLDQLMGQLPSSRFTPSRPFLHTGLDYAGPFNLKSMKIRGFSTYKGWIALFVCFVTKAIHLELVSDMTTEAFIAAFKRFAGRRGLPSDLHSDNQTTFVGADDELQKAFQELKESIGDFLTNEGVTWHFVPPKSPHFGGLWEAGVKSVKYHLRRSLGETILNFEEMTTILVQIEAVLNSRPLCSISDDPEVFTPLTPAHFLIGAPLLSVPSGPTLLDVSMNRLNRWQLTQRIVETFWDRWKKEYLNQLQVSYKWTSKNPNLQVGDLVLIKEDGTPPGTWPMGRVVTQHPGTDGLVRAVTLRIGKKLMKRPVVKLIRLPVD